MNSAEKQTVLHCLKSMIDEEVCEECPLYGTTGTDHCEKDCVRLAINALKQEPCTDAISRQAVMDCFKKWQPYMATRLWDFEKELSALPPVKPTEKQEPCENPHIYECSCGYGWDKNKVVRHHFCPNCGRKVQEVEE